MEKSKLFDLASKFAMLYLAVPFLIFSATWLKPFYALLCLAVMGVVIYGTFRNQTKNRQNKIKNGQEMISRSEFCRLLAVFALIVLWVGMSGIGRSAFQNEDHAWRNGMFEMLVKQHWPVVMEGAAEEGLVRRGFSYYMGFWLPAACMGKLFGMGIGYKFQMLWAVIGIYLFYLILCKLLGRIALWPMALFVLFSGMDILGYYVTGTNLRTIGQTEHLEWWCTLFQYSSFTTQLFWVFNQAVPAWLATVLMMAQEDNKQTVLIWALMLLNCTMPCVGLLPFLICKIAAFMPVKRFGKEEILTYAKGIFTFDNLIGGGVVGIISFLYLSKGDEMFSLGLIDLRGGGWLVYLVFLMMEAGILWLSVLWAYKNKPVFYVTFAWLALCPLLDMYGDRNFCMRASIPALVILFIYVVKALTAAWENKKRKHMLVIALLIALGGVTPVHEFNRTIAETYNVYVHGQGMLNQNSVSYEDIMHNGYETTDAEKNLFFRYLCR